MIRAKRLEVTSVRTALPVRSQSRLPLPPVPNAKIRAKKLMDTPHVMRAVLTRRLEATDPVLLMRTPPSPLYP